jgi:hypothetical protein
VRIDLNDVKILFDPVEYVAFCGHYNDARCSRIRFIGQEPGNETSGTSREVPRMDA